MTTERLSAERLAELKAISRDHDLLDEQADELFRELDAVTRERNEARAVLKSAGVLDYDEDFK